MQVETQTVAGTTLYWLPNEILHGPASTRVDLIIHHVFQTLIVCWSKVELRKRLGTTRVINIRSNL